VNRNDGLTTQRRGCHVPEVHRPAGDLLDCGVTYEPGGNGCAGECLRRDESSHSEFRILRESTMHGGDQRRVRVVLPDTPRIARVAARSATAQRTNPHDRRLSDHG